MRAHWSLPLALAIVWALGSTSDASSQDREQDEPKQDEKDEDDVWPHPHFYWAHGLHVDDIFGFDLSLGGDAQNDSAAYANTESVEEVIGEPVEPGVEWRRARAYIAGRRGTSLEFLIRYDFAVSNPPNLKDAYIGFKRIPLVNKVPFLRTLRIFAGRFKTPLGIDGSMSSSDTPLMERALTSAFLPSRNTGFLFHGASINLKTKIRWSLGYLQPESNTEDIQNKDNLGISARLATAFQLQEDRLLHLGVDYWHRNVDPTIQIASPPESHIAPEFVDTGDIPASGADQLVVEGAWQRGPLTFQGEVVGVRISSEPTGDPKFYAFYAQASYFLTGETRPYVPEHGTFARPRPKREFRDGHGGKGALELACRFSRIDLDDQGVSGGRLNDLSVGFNWYPVFRSRVMFNFILANRSDAEPVMIFQGRLQVAF